jgi:ATP-dependent helicase/nuclease subunit A
MNALKPPNLPITPNPQLPAQDIAPFTANGRAVSETAFQALALNTQQNVVIEACAGSGKTWLLVARLLKLLLQGVAPANIVAITFTRKAAQEMKERLADMLDAINAASTYATSNATANDKNNDTPNTAAEGLNLLQALGYAADDTTFGLAKAAWQRCTLQGEWPSVVTFHEWFGDLRNNAPLSSLASAGAKLNDDEAELMAQAWQAFWRDSRDHAPLRHAMRQGVAALGLAQFETVLEAILARRAEWLVYAEQLTIITATTAPVLSNVSNEGEFADEIDPIALQVDAAQARFEAVLGLPTLATMQYEIQALKPCLQSIASIYGISKTAMAIKRAEALAAALTHLTRLNDSVQNGQISAKQLRGAVNALLNSISNVDGSLPAKITFKDIEPAINAHADYGSETAFKDAVLNVYTDLSHIKNQLLLQQTLPTHRAMLYCGVQWINRYQALKQAQSCMDFADLELDALHLLGAKNADSDTPLLSFAQLGLTVQHVLLDEFQDTNPVQWQALQAFLMPLLRESTAGGQPASVFVVGDPKQSIYRFRRADPRLFTHVQQLLHAQFGAVLLKTQRTRRNAALINDWVNAVFAPTIDVAVAVDNFASKPERNPLFSKQFTLSERRGTVGVLPLIKLEHPEADTPDTPDTDTDDNAAYTSDAATLEAQQVLQTLQAWKLRNPLKPWSQAMVLARKRQPLAVIAKTLRRAGIDYVNAEKGGFFALPEIADIMALLAALANPSDGLAVLTALRSPLFAFSDAQLSHLLIHSLNPTQTSQNTETNQNAEPLPEMPEQSPPWLGIGTLNFPWAKHTAQWLTLWQTLCNSLPMHDALDAMLHQGQWLPRFASSYPERADSVATHLAQLLQLSLNVDQGRYPSLQRFVQAVAELRTNDATAAQSPLHSDAVRLLTIHGAKGLEADCVCLMDLYSKSSKDKPFKVLLNWLPEHAAPSLFALQLCSDAVLKSSPVLADLLAAQQAAELSERDTLLYVAMTRAVDELWASAHPKKNIKDAVYTRINAALMRLNRPEPSEPLTTKATIDTLDTVDMLGMLDTFKFSNDAATALPMPTLLSEKPAPIAVLRTAKPPDEQHSVQALGVLMHSIFEHALRHGALPPVHLISQWRLPLDISQHGANRLLQSCSAMLETTQLLDLPMLPQLRHLALEEDLWCMRTGKDSPENRIGKLLRPDIVVYYQGNNTDLNSALNSALDSTFNSALNAWVIDFKLSFDTADTPTADDYAAQLKQYLTALRSAHLAQATGYLLTLNGECFRLDEGLESRLENSLENGLENGRIATWQRCEVPWI